MNLAKLSTIFPLIFRNLVNWKYYDISILESSSSTDHNLFSSYSSTYITNFKEKLRAVQQTNFSGALYCIVLYCIVLYCIMRPYTEGRLDRYSIPRELSEIRTQPWLSEGSLICDPCHQRGQGNNQQHTATVPTMSSLRYT